MLGATARVLVHHVHQLAHAGAAIAGDAHGLAPARSHHLAAHHQQAVFRARNEALHNHLRAFGFGQGESGFDFRLVRQLQRDAARVVAIRGLDGDGRANLLRHFPGLFGAGHHAALGHGHAASREQAFGEVFVLRNAFGNGAGLVAFCGPNAPLRCAVAQLHQVAVVEANVGNAPFAGRIDDAAGAGAQVAVVDAGFDGLDGGFEVERLVVDGGHQEPVPPGQGGARHGLFGAAKHHAVHAAL